MKLLENMFQEKKLHISHSRDSRNERNTS